MISDFQEVLRRASNGDEDDFAALWREYQPALIRFLTALVGREDAPDVASTVWLEVVRGLDRFVGDEAGFRAWLFTMARRRSIDLRRSRGRRPESPVAELNDERPASDHLDPQARLEVQHSTDSALRLIGELPPDQAEVVLLRIVADLDVAAVAEVVGKRPGTVRVLCHRGLRTLHTRLTSDAKSARDVTR